MYLVNNFGRVVELKDEAEAELKIKRKIMRVATPQEIDRYLDHQRERNTEPASGAETIYYQTVTRTPDGYGMSRDIIKRELALLGIMLTEGFLHQKVGFIYSHPPALASVRNDVRLLYTMFESDKIPAEWGEFLAEADQIIVPSKFVQRTLIKYGFDSTVVPLGFNHRVFQYVDRPIPVDNHEPFTFIHYDSFNYRKGFAEVFEAFNQEFKANESVRLVLKSVHDKAPLPIIKAEYPNIDVVLGELSEGKLAELLSGAHCMVYPSRGEGFGITPLEAMATGIPAIVPNAHGISEYFDPDCMLEVEVESTTPALYRKYKDQDLGDMVLCSVEDLRKKMRFAFNHQAEMKKVGKRASEYVQQFSYEKTAQELAKIINAWQNKEVPKRRDAKFLPVERL